MARFDAVKADGEAPSRVFDLLTAEEPQTLPQIAQGDANKMWIVPSEFSKALEGLSRLAGGEGGEVRLVDPATGAVTEVPDAHREAVPAVAFGRTFFVTGSAID